MLWHCDTLTLGPASPKFQALVGWREPPEEYVYELAILLATPGVTKLDVGNWFRKRLPRKLLERAEGLSGRWVAEGRENALSVAPSDSWAMLRLTPRGSVPSGWARATILEVGVEEVARRLGVDVGVVKAWRNRARTTVGVVP